MCRADISTAEERTAGGPGRAGAAALADQKNTYCLACAACLPHAAPFPTHCPAPASSPLPWVVDWRTHGTPLTRPFATATASPPSPQHRLCHRAAASPQRAAHTAASLRACDTGAARCCTAFACREFIFTVGRTDVLTPVARSPHLSYSGERLWTWQTHPLVGRECHRWTILGILHSSTLFRFGMLDMERDVNRVSCRHGQRITCFCGCLRAFTPLRWDTI